MLYLITPEETIHDEHALIARMFEHHLHKLHIRKPHFTTAEYRDYINGIPSAYHNRLVIHGAFELLREYPGTGIHLNSHNRQDAALAASARALQPATISTSFHSWQEIMDNQENYDYVFISPVFDSISKKGYKATIDLGGCKALRQWAGKEGRQLPHILGLGGVDVSGIIQLKGAGFSGAALLGSVWQSPDPFAAWAELLSTSSGPAGY